MADRVRQGQAMLWLTDVPSPVIIRRIILCILKGRIMDSPQFFHLFSLRTFIRQTAVLLLAACILALAFNAVRPRGISLVENWTEKSQSRQRSWGVEMISFDEFTVLKEDQNVILLDARNPDYYSESHIPNALNLPAHRFEEFYPRLKDSFSDDTIIITYCEGYNCTLGDELAELLFAAGHSQIRVYGGGIEEWINNNMPIEGRHGES